MRLSGKHILLGVTGSISAYKAAEICRLLVKEGAEVKVVMTKAATEFIGAITLSALSKNPVGLHMINRDKTWNNHVELGLWADLILIAPASANTIAKLASGECDNLLQAVYLSARCPVMIAPAMDHDMFLHTSTQENLKSLRGRKHLIIGPAKGELASGLSGEGRLEEPEIILKSIDDFFNSAKELSGKKVLVTAGPTREPIDPVRFISNHSSGKMGLALAIALADKGAEVIMVTGPVHLSIPSYIKCIEVETAAQMYTECIKYFPSVDIAVMAAAVADYTPAKIADEKIKKKDSEWNLEMTKTVDILAECGKVKKQQFMVGFALETNNELEHAKEKLKKKNLDLIVLNSLRDKGAGFASETNKITLIDKHNNINEYPLKNKSDVAYDIVRKIIELTHA